MKRLTQSEAFERLALMPSRTWQARTLIYGHGICNQIDFLYRQDGAVSYSTLTKMLRTIARLGNQRWVYRRDSFFWPPKQIHIREIACAFLADASFRRSL